MKHRPLLLLFALLSTLGTVVPTAAAEEPPTWDFLPARREYAPYLADPLRPAFAATYLGYSETDVPGAGDARIGLKMGGMIPIVAWHPGGRAERPWTLSLAAGFNGQFDLDHDQDNVGWDGIYGLMVEHRVGPRWAIELGTLHYSSHVGDELAERTGIRRIEYTREEFLAGASWYPTPRWRLYGDAAWAYTRRTKRLQDPGRAEVGTEIYFPFPRGAVWDSYVALDLNSFEERDWEVDLSTQIGVRQTEGPWRFGIGWASGRVPIGEFFQHDETYVSIGAWYDLGDWSRSGN